jgi:hypothetical protein
VADVLEVAVFEAEGILDTKLADVVLRSARRVRELEAAGKIEPAWHDVGLETGVKRFTDELERPTAHK